MITITFGLIFFLIGIEFLFFTNRLQCDAENACRETNFLYRPIPEWLKNPQHSVPLRIIGGLNLVFSLYLFYSVE